jgi:hypothetical protein
LHRVAQLFFLASGLDPAAFSAPVMSLLNSEWETRLRYGIENKVPQLLDAPVFSALCESTERWRGGAESFRHHLMPVYGIM